MTNREKLIQFGYQDVLLYQNPDFDQAIIGVDANSNAVIYDFDLMVQDMVKKDGVTQEEATEFIQYNTIRATPYMPQPRPIILRKLMD